MSLAGLTFLAVCACALAGFGCWSQLEHIGNALERIEEHMRPAGHAFSDDFAEIEDVS
jgi:hypothetical protein